MHESNWLRDGVAVGGGAAVVLTILHCTLDDDDAEADDVTGDPRVRAARRVGAYGADVLTLLGGLYVWSRYRPEASASAAIIVLTGEALFGGAALSLLHWWRNHAELLRAQAARLVAERLERNCAHWQTTPRVRPREVGE